MKPSTRGKRPSAAKHPSRTRAPFAQRGVAATRRKAELQHVRWADVEIEQLNPLLGRQFIVGGEVMIARILLKKGSIVPEHHHVNEQVTYVLEGALRFRIDGRDITVNAGEVLTIPPDMPHEVEALADTVDLDVFNPPRADWINKDDQYLRRAAAPADMRAATARADVRRGGSETRPNGRVSGRK